jgi:hypothetical protein
MTNFNVAYSPDYADHVQKSFETGKMTISGLDTAMPGDVKHPDRTTSFSRLLLSFAQACRLLGRSMSGVCVPVFDSFDYDQKPTALMFLFSVGPHT